MIVVIATSPHEVAGVRAQLDSLGIRAVRLLTPSADRRLVLATVDDERKAAQLAATLRDQGRVAVTRPERGAPLDEWMRHTLPITFGDRLSVCFAWSEHDRDNLPGLIELGTGGFGSGQHIATRLVIEQLVDRIHGGERVLDLGCGSGILGLCALGLGASRVVAVDVKPAAVEATRRNAVLNGMDQRVVATHAAISELEGSFDAVVANVGRAAAVELASHLVHLVAPGGWLAVSGIAPSQCSLVAGFLRPLVEVEQRTSGEWAVLVLTPP